MLAMSSKLSDIRLKNMSDVREYLKLAEGKNGGAKQEGEQIDVFTIDQKKLAVSSPSMRAEG